MTVSMKLEPFAIFLHRTVDQLLSFDTAGIFGRPVTLQEVVRLFCIWLHSCDLALYFHPEHKLTLYTNCNFITEFIPERGHLVS